MLKNNKKKKKRQFFTTLICLKIGNIVMLSYKDYSYIEISAIMNKLKPTFFVPNNNP